MVFLIFIKNVAQKNDLNETNVAQKNDLNGTNVAQKNELNETNVAQKNDLNATKMSHRKTNSMGQNRNKKGIEKVAKKVGKYVIFCRKILVKIA